MRQLEGTVESSQMWSLGDVSQFGDVSDFIEKFLIDSEQLCHGASLLSEAVGYCCIDSKWAENKHMSPLKGYHA